MAGYGFVSGVRANRIVFAAMAVLVLGSATEEAAAQTYDQIIGTSQTSTVNLVKPGTTVLVAAGVTLIPAAGSAIFGQLGDDWSITNLGTITAVGSVAIQLQGNVASVTNNSVISGVGGIYSSSSLTLVNNAGASIVTDFYAVSNSIPNTGPGSSIDNYGLLQGGYAAISLTASTSVTGVNTIDNHAGGQIIGTLATGNGITVLHSSTTITNYAGALIQGAQSGISGSDLFTEVIVNNAGSIVGGTGAGIWSYGGGPISNQAGGVITGAGGIAYVRARYNDTDIVTNAGTITGTGTTFIAGNGVNAGSGAGIYFGAVYAPVGGFVNNLATGRIEGGVYGIYSASAVLADDIGPIFIDNAGTIVGQTGIALNGADETIVNSGVITGSGGTAISFDQTGSFHNRLTLDTGSVLNGIVLGGPGQDDLILKGTNSEDVSKLRSMETLSMAGVDWTLDGNGAFSTSIDIASGTLRVNGTIASPTTTVQAGSVLAGTGTIAGDVTNAGTLAPGSNGTGTFTIRGNYLGDNATLVIKSVLGGDNSPGDRLIIDTGTATGDTMLRVVNLNGGGAQTTRDGILVIEAVNGGTTAADAFRLGGRVAAGAYEYTLYRGGETSADNWYLRSELQLSPEPDNPGGGFIEVPDFRAEFPLMSAVTPIALEYGYAMLDTLHERVGESWNSLPVIPGYEDRLARGRNGSNQVVRVPVARGTVDQGKWFSGAWGRVIGDRGFRDNDNFGRRGPDYDYTFAGLQAGLDIFAREQADGTSDKAGFYVGYGQIDANVKGAWKGRAGTVDMDAYTLGGYWTHKAAQGWYSDAVIQGTWYSADARSIHGQQLKPDGFGIIASLEGGYAFRLGDGFAIEPQAQLAYQNVSFDEVSDAYGRFEFSDGESLRARLGVRLTKAWNMADEMKPRLLTGWLRANVWHEFIGDPSTTVSLAGLNPVTVTSSLGGTWGEIGAGVSGQVSDDVSLFATGAYNRSLDNRGREAWDGRLGITAKW